jgi:hypothetical protein
MIRVSGAFVTKFEEALSRAEANGSRYEVPEDDSMRSLHIKAHCIPHKLAIEEFLEEMKYELAQVIFPEVMPGARISLPKPQISLDKNL